MAKTPILSVDSVETWFGSQCVHKNVTFSIDTPSIVAIIGGSGSGKSVLLREILGLLKPTSGEVRLFGENLWTLSEKESREIRNRIGVLFQNGALFSGINVAENVAVPLMEQMDLDSELVKEIVQLRLSLSGLSSEVSKKMPSELSGGMRKRAALARALALEPEILFLDEPTSGLDPINARAFDKLIRTLCDSIGLTVVIITHDLDTIEGIVDKVVALGEGKVLMEGTAEEVAKSSHPWIRSYFESRLSPR